MMKTLNRKVVRAFTLMEMLIVLTVAGIIIAFAAPDIFSVINSSSLTSEGSLLKNQLTQAQQLAVAQNEDVEIRFFKLTDAGAAQTEPGYRGFQFFQFDENGEMIESSTFFRIKSPIIVSESLSSILDASNRPSAEDDAVGYSSPRAGQYKIPGGDDTTLTDYVGFRFRADGSTDLPNRAGGDTWYITLLQGNDATGTDVPNNYLALQINPYNGQVSEFRP